MFDILCMLVILDYFSFMGSTGANKIVIAAVSQFNPLNIQSFFFEG